MIVVGDLGVGGIGHARHLRSYARCVRPAVRSIGLVLALAACHKAPAPDPLDEAGAMMLDSTRVDLMRPDEIVRHVAPRSDAIVVDFGAGPGAFTHAWARAVPQGKVIAADVKQGYLDRIVRDVAKRHETHVETRLVRVGETGLDDASADVIFLCQVDHYFADRRAMLERLARALKPGGRIVIVNYLRGARTLDEAARVLGWQQLDAWRPADGFFGRVFAPTSS